MVKRLQRRYGNIYRMENVIFSGTHTHGTPGGFMMHLLYDMTTFGFVPETYGALVIGIFRVSVHHSNESIQKLILILFFFDQSVVRAHEGMRNGRLYIGETEILDANINRSPTSYLKNPAEERAA